MSTVALPPYAPLAPAPPAVFINPAQVHSNSTPAPKKRSPPAKRKHVDDTLEESGDSATQPKKRDGPKKKKAVRACFNCQKAHLTCDDSRPCQRCVKLDKTCTEGHRKKAKYLLDDDELEELKRRKSKGTESTPTPTPTQPPAPASAPASAAPLPPPPPPPPTQPIPDLADPFPDDSLFSSAFDSTFSFGSEAANLEYSILSAILGNPSPPEESVPTSPVTASFSSWPSETLANSFPSSPKINDTHSFNSPYSAETRLSMPPDTTLSSLSTAASPTFITSYPYPITTTPQDILPFTSQASPQRLLHSIQSRRSADVPTATGNMSTRSGPEGLSSAHLSPAESTSSPALSNGACVEPTAKSTGAPSALQGINERVTTPYDYTEGYHFLMKHLPGRFEKNDILRIVRALAIFRPSLIALQMPLSLDDEVFLEKCFQRSLIELEKLISFSGTPTVVWRRTGEICLVAPEFSLLTDWSKEELLGKKKYIYELFEKQSVVEYWENFASHAFENTTQSVYSHCVLLKPNGTPVPATFCFSIRRDLFDLPSVVIGQWLPLL